MGPAAGLGVELDGESSAMLVVVDALAGAVVGVDVAHLPPSVGQGVAVHGVAVVLAGDEGAAVLPDA